MAVDPRYYHYQQRKRHLKDFEHKAKLLLNDRDRKYLYSVLKDYQKHRNVDLLVTNLHQTLDTPTKMDLLMDIRYFIPSTHLSRFDQIAPYHRMAHPIQLRTSDYSPMHNYYSLGRIYSGRSNSQRQPTTVTSGTMSLGRRARSAVSSPQTPKRTQSQSQKGRQIEETSAEETGPIRTLMLIREPDENLGFSVRGGSEHGLGIYVSEIIQHSPADRAGIEPGDHILEVNSIRFENIASSSAIKVLTGTSRLKLIVQRVGKIPGFKFAREKTSWYDIDEGRMVEGTYEDHGTFHVPAGMSFVDGVIERRIHLSLTKENQFLGFNVRGGSEYGLGIYVSRVDPGGIAEQFGLKIGDQIMSVNGQSFERISHSDAVDVLRAHKTLVMTVWDVGKYPAFKEIYAEYSWMDTLTGGITRSRIYRKQQFGSGLITSVPVTPAHHTPDGSFMEFPQDSVVDYRMDSHQGEFNNSLDENDVMHDDSRTSVGVPSLLQDLDDLDRGGGGGGGGGGRGAIGRMMTEEQVRVMSFPENARLVIPDSSSPTISDPSTRDDPNDDRFDLDQPDAVIEHFDNMLIPHSHDVILQEMPETLADDVRAEGSGGGGGGKDKDSKSGSMLSLLSSKKKNSAPRSQIGVLALELENMPDDRKKQHKAERERIQSLRNPGDINPRQFEDIELNVKKSRTFREMLFGTKARVKSKGQVPLPKTKTRQPLSNLGFTQVGSQPPTASESIELNLEQGGSGEAGAKFVRGVGSQVMLHGAGHQQQHASLHMLQQHARLLLNQDELLALNRHIKRYESGGSLESMMKPLNAILDTPEKRQLFTEIRGSIRPGDVAGFDTMVTKQDANMYEELTEPAAVVRAQVSNEKEGTGAVNNTNIHKVKEKTAETLLREEKDNRVKLARMAQEKRQSLSDELAFSVDDRRKKERVTTSSPSAQHVLEIHRPKSNSKVYKALRTGDSSSSKSPSVSNQVSPRSTSSSSVFSSPRRGEVFNKLPVQPAAETFVFTSSPIQSRQSSTSTSSSIAGHSTYNTNSPPSKAAGSSLSRGDKGGDVFARMYDMAGDSADTETDSGVVLLRKTLNTEEDISPTRDMSRQTVHKQQSDSEGGVPSDSLVAALEILDELDLDCEGDYGGYQQSQVSPRSVASISTIASTRFGSYDVQSSIAGGEEEEGSIPDSPSRHPPVFVPPPPPSDPPPPGEEQEEEDIGDWDEWLTEDVTQEVIHNSSVGMGHHQSTVVQHTGSSPHNSPRHSTASPNTLDYFTGSQNDHSFQQNLNSSFQNNNNNGISQNNDHDKRTGSTLSNKGTFTKSTESLPQVNSLRDTLRNRRKSADRPKLGLNTYMAPDNLFPADWGRRSQINQEEKDKAANSKDNSRVGYTSSSGMQYSNGSQSSETHYNENMSNNLGPASSPVTSEEVNRFMTEPECKGDVLYRRTRSSIHTMLLQATQPSTLDVEGEELTNGREPTLVLLKKTKASLGLSISGGRDSRSQPEIKIKDVFPGGAAADAGTLKSGMHLLSIDGHSLAHVSHSEAVNIIRQSYSNKRVSDMELLVHLL